MLRAAGGFTGRANSVLPLGDPGRPLPDAVRAAEAWYAERGLSPMFTLFGPEGSRSPTTFSARCWPPGATPTSTGPW